MEYPDDLRYTKEHEWARVEGNVVRIGITDFAQDALGDVVYVDLPDVGTEVHAGQAFAEVESTKSVSDVFSPIEGSIVERNPLIDEHSELVNEQPYGDGWLVLLAARRISLRWKGSWTPPHTGRSSKRAPTSPPTVELQDDRGLRPSSTTC